MIQRLRRVESGLWVALAMWFAARVFAYGFAGLRFNSIPVFTFWQMVDVELLKHDLLRSVWYLHSQPPGFNLFVGALLKLFPGTSFDHGYWAIQVALGLLITVLLYQLMRWFSIRPLWSGLLTGAFVASPACILFESTAVYEYPVMALILLATLSLGWFLRSGRARDLWISGGALLVLSLTRNLFHISYLFVVAAGLYWILRDRRRLILSVFVPVLLLALAPYVKNEMLFGRFTASTWVGMQTGFVTSNQLSDPEADALIAQGVASPLIKIRPFSSMKEYAPFVTRQIPATGVPVLDSVVTSRGYDNYNALVYLDIHDQYLVNSKAVLRAKPVSYLRGQMSSWFSYFLPASDLPYYFPHQTELFRRWERAFSTVVFGQVYRSTQRTELVPLREQKRYMKIALYSGVVLMIVIPGLTLWGILQLAWPSLRRRWDLARGVLLAFILITMIAQTVIGNVIACCETNRYRFPLEPYLMVLSGLVLTSAPASTREEQLEIQKP